MNDNERLTEKTIGSFEYDLKNFQHTVGEFRTYEAFFAYSMAVRKLGKYEDIGTVEEIKIAMKKQIPKKPIIEKWSPALCPGCGEELSESLGDGYYKHHYGRKVCDCGQKLKWE